jgi:hypothetical protein
LERGEGGIRRQPDQLHQIEESRGWCQAYLLSPWHLATSAVARRQVLSGLE